MKNVVIILCLLCLSACGTSSTTSVGNGSFVVSGTVTSNGVALSGVTVLFTGTSSGTATTDSDGKYSFTGVTIGVYQVNAAKDGYAVTPASLSVRVFNTNVTGKDFSATPANYSITGTVTESGTGLADVTIALTGTSLIGPTFTTATTDSNGTYSLPVIGGSYTISAAKTGYVIPDTLPVTVSNADVTGQDFTATPASYVVSGTITASGAPLSGTTVTLSGFATGTTATDTNGNYSFSVLNGSYTVTPTMTGYTFTPASLSQTVDNANVTDQNFTAAVSIYTLSGTITESGAPLSGATVTLSGSATGTTTTDTSGNYSFSVCNGDYTVTPSKTGYGFTPASLSKTVSNADVTGQNFTAFIRTYTLSGTITESGAALSGATVTLSGSATGTTTTNTSGTFHFSVYNGSYTVTPTLTGYTFTPASLSQTVGNANVTGQDFTANSASASVQLAKTGQTTSYATGDDGNLKIGVAWPDPRFTDNGDGTVTDNLTGLIWLQHANCFGLQNWAAALASANNLASNTGQCGLSDGSTAGQWRLPNITELESLADAEHYDPALPAGHPFNNVQANLYWSSSSCAGNTYYAWIVLMDVGNVNYFNKSNDLYVWPVRAGQ